MKKQLSYKVSAFVGAVIMLPCLILEVVNNTLATFPFVLFFFLWLMPFVFILVIDHFKSRKNKLNTIRSAAITCFQIVLLLAVTASWLQLIIDQFPCFLGLANCD
jgi:hypothetical protein